MNITRNEVLEKLQSIFDELFLEEVIVTPELSAYDVENFFYTFLWSLLSKKFSTSGFSSARWKRPAMSVSSPT